jgi:hypothetical protein
MAKRKKKRGARSKVNPFARVTVPSRAHRKVWAPDTPFARVAAPPTHSPPDIVFGSSLGPVPGAIDWDQIDEMTRNSVFDELVRIDVDPALAAELARINPEGWYVVVATVRGGSGSAGASDGERRGIDATNRAVFVGRGVRLWGRFLHLCDPDGGGSELVDLEVYELNVPAGDSGEKDSFPLWSGQTVTTVDGEVIEGAGERVLWEQRQAEVRARKRGRKKKSGGGMTASERRAEKKRSRERDRRKQKTKAKRRKLEDARDFTAVAAIQRRRETGLRSATRKRKPGKGRTR